ncbi:MAG: patatin-like phospholipase family protein [Flavobacteriales bacterium]|nr:patatin-like phospholipase family protein [Flavobacteriales bacterium]MCB9447621.1 patatin-like phospholipase family protein [Flavobacteriales bacterium]
MSTPDDNGFWNSERWSRLYYFFPFQLLVLHLKKNQLLLVFWAIMFGFVGQHILVRYGIPYLFLDPEYLGRVDFFSYLFMGVTAGAFIMAFHISSYIGNSFRFPFLATLSRPFWKFCVNNSAIPFAFCIYYSYKIYLFQGENEFVPFGDTVIDILGFLLGVFLFIAFAFAYFFNTNKDLFKMFGVRVDMEGPPDMQVRTLGDTKYIIQKHAEKPPPKKSRRGKEWRVDTYMTSPFNMRLARKSFHYDRAMLERVFRQNHTMAAIFEMILIGALIALGLFREVKYFMIPAGASIILLFTMFLMLTNALKFWLRGWSFTVYGLLFLLINFMAQFEFFNPGNRAVGMNYQTQSKPAYTIDHLQALNYDPEMNHKDISRTVEILNNWKKKNESLYPEKKPKLVIVNTSGGGLRAAVWTFRALQYADSVSGQQLMKHMMLITGSSGGMIGAAYLRELYYRSQTADTNHINLNNPQYLDNIGTDILNPMAFSVAVNDFFLRIQQFEYEGQTYRKDRGFAFEQQLNTNTGNILEHRLKDYTIAEYSATIPMMVLTPSILNDGRRLYISAQPISYLTQNAPVDNLVNDPLLEGIEFTRFFSDQNPYNLRFTSALRMNATFPYICPIVYLPSEPPIQVMDAGLRDNFGLKTSLKFIYSFRSWIANNTSGVILIQVRDRYKEYEVDKNPRGTLVQNMLNPIGKMYDNLFITQDMDHDQLLQYASKWFGNTIDVIKLQMYNEQDDKVALSWHLTTKEKKKIHNAVLEAPNQEAFEKIRDMLKP